jgi:hypothetical protein
MLASQARLGGVSYSQPQARPRALGEQITELVNVK